MAACAGGAHAHPPLVGSHPVRPGGQGVGYRQFLRRKRPDVEGAKEHAGDLPRSSALRTTDGTQAVSRNRLVAARTAADRSLHAL